MCFTPIVDQPSCPSPPRVFVHNEALGREVPTEQPTPSTPATRNDGFQLSSPSTRAASTLPSSPTLANPDTIIGSSPVAACGRSSSHQNSPEAAGAEEQSPKTITTTVSVVGPDGMKRPHRLLMSQSVGTDQDGHMMLGFSCPACHVHLANHNSIRSHTRRCVQLLRDLTLDTLDPLVPVSIQLEPYGFLLVQEPSLLFCTGCAQYVDRKHITVRTSSDGGHPAITHQQKKELHRALDQLPAHVSPKDPASAHMPKVLDQALPHVPSMNDSFVCNHCYATFLDRRSLDRHVQQAYHAPAKARYPSQKISKGLRLPIIAPAERTRLGMGPSEPTAEPVDTEVSHTAVGPSVQHAEHSTSGLDPLNTSSCITVQDVVTVDERTDGEVTKDVSIAPGAAETLEQLGQTTELGDVAGVDNTIAQVPNPTQQGDTTLVQASDAPPPDEEDDPPPLYTLALPKTAAQKSCANRLIPRHYMEDPMSMGTGEEDMGPWPRAWHATTVFGATDLLPFATMIKSANGASNKHAEALLLGIVQKLLADVRPYSSQFKPEHHREWESYHRFGLELQTETVKRYVKHQVKFFLFMQSLQQGRSSDDAGVSRLCDLFLGQLEKGLGKDSGQSGREQLQEMIEAVLLPDSDETWTDAYARKDVLELPLSRQVMRMYDTVVRQSWNRSPEFVGPYWAFAFSHLLGTQNPSPEGSTTFGPAPGADDDEEEDGDQAEDANGASVPGEPVSSEARTFIKAPRFVSPTLAGLVWMTRVTAAASYVLERERQQLDDPDKVATMLTGYLKDNVDMEKTTRVSSHLQAMLQYCSRARNPIGDDQLYVPRADRVTLPSGLTLHDSTLHEFAIRCEAQLQDNLANLLSLGQPRYGDVINREPTPRRIEDELNNMSDEYSFATDHRNCLPPDSPESIYATFRDRVRRENKANPQLGFQGHWNRAERTLLSLENKFLESLLLCLYVTAGVAPRGQELVSVRYRNETAVARGIYVADDTNQLFMLIQRSKTSLHNNPHTALKSARFLTPGSSRALLRYLLEARPWLDRVRYERSRPSADAEPTAQLVQPLLFVDPNSKRMSPDVLRKGLRAVWPDPVVAPKLTLQIWRQYTVCLSKRLVAQHLSPDEPLQPMTTEDMGDAEFAETNVMFAAQAAQSGHSVQTAQLLYARSPHELGHLTSGTLYHSEKASLAWQQQVLGMDTQPTALRPFSKTAQPGNFVGPSPARRLHDALRLGDREFGYANGLRPHQRQALHHILLSTKGSAIMVTLPTGAGKTNLWMLPARSGPAENVQVVLLPLSAMHDDYARRLRHKGVPYDDWTRMPPEHQRTLRLSSGSRVLLASVSHLATATFLNALGLLAQQQRLEHIFVDEAHMLVTHASFRAVFLQLGGLAELLPHTKLVCLTATAPAGLVQEMENQLSEDGRPVRFSEFRAPSDRPEVQYTVQEVPSVGQLLPTAKQELTLRLQQRDHWRDHAGVARPHRALVICNTRLQAQQLADSMEVPYYIPAKTDEAGNTYEDSHGDQALAEFIYGSEVVMVGTTSLASWLDVPDIDLVVWVGLPYTGLDLIQAAGRAARGPGATGRLVCLVAKSEVDQRYRRELEGYGGERDYLGNVGHWVMYSPCLVESVHQLLDNKSVRCQDLMSARCTACEKGGPCMPVSVPVVRDTVVGKPKANDAAEPLAVPTQPNRNDGHRDTHTGYPLGQDPQQPITVPSTPDSGNMITAEELELSGFFSDFELTPEPETGPPSKGAWPPSSSVPTLIPTQTTTDLQPAQTSSRCVPGIPSTAPSRAPMFGARSQSGMGSTPEAGCRSASSCCCTVGGSSLVLGKRGMNEQEGEPNPRPSKQPDLNRSTNLEWIHRAGLVRSEIEVASSQTECSLCWLRSKCARNRGNRSVGHEDWRTHHTRDCRAPMDAGTVHGLKRKLNAVPKTCYGCYWPQRVNGVNVCPGAGAANDRPMKQACDQVHRSTLQSVPSLLAALLAAPDDCQQYHVDHCRWLLRGKPRELAKLPRTLSKPTWERNDWDWNREVRIAGHALNAGAFLVLSVLIGRDEDARKLVH